MLLKENIETVQSRQTNPNLPPTLDASPQEGVAAYREVWLENGISMMGWASATFDAEAEDLFLSNMQLYLIDSISLEELMKRTEAEIVPTFQRNAKKLGINIQWVKDQLRKSNEPIPDWLAKLN